MKKSHKRFSASEPIFFSKVFLQFGQLKGKLGWTKKATLSNWVLWMPLNTSIFGARSPSGLVWSIFHHIVLLISQVSQPGRRAPMTHLDKAEEGVVLHTTLPKVFAGLP